MKMSLIVCVVVQIIIKQTVIAVNVIITVIFPVRLIQIIKHSELMDDGHIWNRLNVILLYPWFHNALRISFDNIGVHELYV